MNELVYVFIVGFTLGSLLTLKIISWRSNKKSELEREVDKFYAMKERS